MTTNENAPIEARHWEKLAQIEDRYMATAHAQTLANLEAARAENAELTNRLAEINAIAEEDNWALAISSNLDPERKVAALASGITSCPCPKCAASETNAIADIADMMTNHVDNWPAPKKLKTAIALIDKALTAALKDTVPRDVAESWKARADNKTEECARKDKAMGAFRREVSEAAHLTLRMLLSYGSARDEAEDILSRFIIPPADPVADALKAAMLEVAQDAAEANGLKLTGYQVEQEAAENLLRAAAKHGLTIELKSRLPLGGAK